MMEPVAKLTEETIKTVENMDTAQLEVPIKAIPRMGMFSPKKDDKGDVG